MKRERNVALLVSFTFVALHASGCASTPEPTGFLSDYSRLEKTGQARMGFVSPQLNDYNAFIVDPVEYRIDRDKQVITDEQKAEIANYFRKSFDRALSDDHSSLAGVAAGFPGLRQHPDS